MLGIDIRAARVTWTVFLFALLVATAYAIRATLVVLALSLFFAYMLMPLVGLVERYTPPIISSTVALALVYLALIGILVALGFTLGTRIADEANLLGERLPSLIQGGAWMNKIPLPDWLEPVREKIIGSIQAQFSKGSNVLPFVRDIGTKILSVSRYLLDAILVPILAFFFLKDGQKMRDALVDSLVDPSRRPMVDEILSDINQLLGKYIRALVLLSLSTFTSYSLFLGITGAPYAVLLAGFAAIFDFVPVVGPLAAGILVIVVEGLSGYTHVIAYIVFWIFFRLFQDYVLSPFLMGAGVELDPLLVLFGVLAGERVAGIPGMFFSVPVIAILRVMFIGAKRARRRRRLAPEEIPEVTT